MPWNNSNECQVRLLKQPEISLKCFSTTDSEVVGSFKIQKHLTDLTEEASSWLFKACGAIFAFFLYFSPRSVVFTNTQALLFLQEKKKEKKEREKKQKTDPTTIWTMQAYDIQEMEAAVRKTQNVKYYWSHRPVKTIIVVIITNH